MRLAWQQRTHPVANKSLIIDDPELTLDQKVAALLGCVAMEQKSRIEQILGQRQLSFLQLNLLHALSRTDDGTMTVSGLKAAMVDDNPNVSRTLNKMVDAGLITKRRSEEDQRTVFVSITEKGERAHREADAALLEAGVEGTGLDRKEQLQLYHLLKKL